MTIIKTICAAAAAVTLLSVSVNADSKPAIKELDGVSPQGEIVGKSGKFFFPLLVSDTAGNIYECSNRIIERNDMKLRVCAGTGGLRDTRVGSPITATRSSN